MISLVLQNIPPVGSFIVKSQATCSMSFLNWTPNSFHGLAVRNSRRDTSPAFHSWGSGLMSNGMCLVKMRGVWAAGSLHRGIHWGQLLFLHQENLKINLSGPHAPRIFWERMSPNPATICPSGVNYRKGKRENAEHSLMRWVCQDKRQGETQTDFARSTI